MRLFGVVECDEREFESDVLKSTGFHRGKPISINGRTSDKIDRMSTQPENTGAGDLESQGFAMPGGEDPLERLLDSESDEEFGGAVMHEHLDADSQPLVLQNWTAKDFADIYVRFYPHVLRQAKRYLTNHSQAEEVTQDAFLYLMTSLPEVDSEVGVLKLLKWKTKFLALDVIRANSGAKFAPLEDQLELSTDDAELSLQLERADDAAIVALALARLEPRQREALVASLYEEKATSEVASQLGLNENATRQLVFRAKAAFKKALVGEAETRGLTLSEILSVAARKASKDAGKYVSVASALLLVLAVSIGILPNLGNSGQQLVAEGGLTAVPESSGSTEQVQVADPTQPAEPAEIVTADAPAETVTDAPRSNDAPVADPALAPIQNADAGSAAAEVADSASIQLTSASNIDRSPFDPWLLDPLVDKSVIQTTLLSGNVGVSSESPTLVTMVSEDGVWADVTFQPGTARPFQRVSIGIGVDGAQYFADVTASDLIVLGSDQKTETYVFVGLIGELRDTTGNSFSQTRLDGARVRVSLTVENATGQILQSSLALDERS